MKRKFNVRRNQRNKSTEKYLSMFGEKPIKQMVQDRRKIITTIEEDIPAQPEGVTGTTYTIEKDLSSIPDIDKFLDNSDEWIAHISTFTSDINLSGQMTSKAESIFDIANQDIVPWTYNYPIYITENYEEASGLINWTYLLDWTASNAYKSTFPSLLNRPVSYAKDGVLMGSPQPLSTTEYSSFNLGFYNVLSIAERAKSKEFIPITMWIDKEEQKLKLILLNHFPNPEASVSKLRLQVYLYNI